MSEARSAQRYLQALFAVAKRKEPFTVTKFRKDSLGRITGFDDIKMTPGLTLDDPHIRKKLERRIDRWALRLLDNIYIKEFPTSTLTVAQLRAYLDNLEATEKFVPDLLIVDYPDLLKMDKDNYRLELDQVFKELRGIAVSRNIALAAVSQSHRSAAKAKQVGIDNVAEAYSKIAHSDTVITYTQTAQEHKLGLARLYVAAGRNDEDKFVIVISQSYNTGQFVVDSAMLRGTYWENLPPSEE
jgi:DnaB-like helicase C terminal domain